MAKRKTVSLTLTHNCNLNCVYCYEGFKDKRTMPLELAKSAVQRHMLNSNGFDEIQIDLAGGEPFLQAEKIRQLCEWMWSRTWTKPYIFFATTNGTLINHKIKPWLQKNKRTICLGLSLDGTPDMHNANRSNSFSKIDINFFKECWPNQAVKMTVSNYSLPSLAQGVIFLHSLGFKVEVNLAYGVDWNDNKNLFEFNKQLRLLIDYYLANESVPHCSLLDMKLTRVRTEREIKKWCGVGTDMVTVDVDGKEYPCHLFQPISMGDKASAAQSLSFTDAKSLVDPKCSNCTIYPICPTCYGVNFWEHNNIGIRDNALCNLTKIRALACSYFEAKKILLHSKPPISSDPDSLTDLTITSIFDIQNFLKNDPINSILCEETT